MEWTRNKSVLRGRLIRTSETKTIRFLLTSDWHYDNPHCERNSIYKHLDELGPDGHAFIFGDLYCLMEGKGDPRGSKNILPAHLGPNYVQKVVEESVMSLLPYKDRIRMVSYGNHETKVMKYKEIDVIQMFCTLFNASGGNVFRGGYGGIVHISSQHQAGGSSKSVTIGYHHGKWGGVQTKGVLGVGRYSAVFPDCDIIVSGHTHDHWLMELPRYRYSQSSDSMYVDTQLHLKTGTYKQEFSGEMTGWAVETIVMPKNVGRGWFVDLIVEPKGLTWKVRQAT